MIEAEELEMMMLDAEERMEKSLDVLKADVLQIRTGRANPHILDKIQVEAYGSMSPINQIGNVSALDAQCLVINAWDKSLLKNIEKAILLSNIGLTPTNDGERIRLVFPMMTDERRRELAFEGHGFFDFHRSQKSVVRTDFHESKNQNVPFPSYQWALPIPLHEMDVNPNMVQNEGY